MKRFISAISVNRNIRDHLWRWSTDFVRNIPTGIYRCIFDKPVHFPTSLHLWLSSWLIGKRHSIQFHRVFPRVSDRSVWHMISILIVRFRYSVWIINRLPWLYVARSPQGRCKVVRKQDVLDMSKTTKLPSIVTTTRARSRKMRSCWTYIVMCIAHGNGNGNGNGNV